MFGHWPVIWPLLAAAEPDVVVEIGVFHGNTTKQVLRHTEDLGTILHAIDPAPDPGLGLEELQDRYGERLVFHRAMSLDALPEIRGADAVLIDGDHNWYTVYNELSTIARVAAEEHQPFPLTLMHDVEWPYDRRDMYYNPDAIPPEYRQPYQQGGMLPHRDELVEEGGLNVTSYNAVAAGGPRNGVKTAIDDFLEETEAPVSFTSVLGFFGLGVLYDERQLEQRPALRERIAELDSPGWLRQQCARIERARVLSLAQVQNLNRERGGRRAAGET